VDFLLSSGCCCFSIVPAFSNLDPFHPLD
jgi:hypothetical protein